jgi:diaminohydroxyphosphoribosylaminopyrimidine deaminase/5-amino-6-(5-phosphoribosylamino)uracil reductase
MPRSSPARSTDPTATEFDQQMIRTVVRLARRGEGRVEPNPMVGCVLVRNGRIIGQGYHRRFGGAHAEVEALRACGVSPRGAAAYVTLEPCCAHEGKKTPPCVDALMTAGVSRVVVGSLDPNPKVHGRGVRQLRRAGIAVCVLGDTGASELIAPFKRFAVDHRPYVIAKWAQSLDGKLASSTGDSRWISCPESRTRVHELRARVDAVLVGIGTVLRDDPLLTARGVRIRRTAARIVLDAGLRIPTSSQLVRTATESPVWVYTTRLNARSPAADDLRKFGVEVIECRAASSRSTPGTARGERPFLSLQELLRMLHRRNVTNLLVEGGPTLLSAFLGSGLVDETHIYVAPILIGNHHSPGALDSRQTTSLSQAMTARRAHVTRSGSDTLFRLRFQ